MKKLWFSTVVLALLVPILPATLHAGPGQKVVRFGVVIDGPWERNKEIRDLFEKEIRDLLSGEFDVRFPADKRIVADWTPEGVYKANAKLLADPEVDILLSVGVLASNCVCLQTGLPKPVLAPVVLDVDLQGLPQKDGASGVKNLSYTAFPNPVRRDLTMFRKIVPFKKLAVFTTYYYMNALKPMKSRFPVVTNEMGVGLQVIPVKESAEEALAQIQPDVDAVYLAPLLHLKSEEFDHLVEGLIERRLPSFALFGKSDVRKGVLAGMNPEDTFPRLARRTALNVQRILLGEEPGTIPFSFPAKDYLTINMATARAIGVWPPFSVLTDAELLNEEVLKVDRVLSLDQAVKEVIASNLDLAAEARAVAAGEQEVKKARSGLLPKVEVSGLGRIIDQDRAGASFGSEAERKLAASASLSQLLYSEPAWSNWSIQKHLQTSREEEEEKLRLDLAREAATAYLNILRAKTFERIEKDNLKLSRSNLEMAQMRESIGTSGPAEVYRWESQIAASRQAVLKAQSQRELAEQALNQLLHRPLDEPFGTEEVGLRDPLLTTSDMRLAGYVNDPWSLHIFRLFMVHEGLERSVELRALDAAIAAQERQLATAKRSFWAPTAVLSGEVSHDLDEGGAGAGGGSLPPMLSGSFPTADDTNWSVGVNVSLPLFEGGERFAEQKRAGEELARLRLERAAARERIDQRIQAAVIKTEASFPSIQLSKDAAEAAGKNMELVTDAYSRGVVSILDLIDAQNAALVADQAAANAVYDFLIDLMEFQRAANCFDFFISPEEREAWFTRMKAFFTEKRGEERRP